MPARPRPATPPPLSDVAPATAIPVGILITNPHNPSNPQYLPPPAPPPPPSQHPSASPLASTTPPPPPLPKCRSDDTRRWIQEQLDESNEIYLVVGLLLLNDAKLVVRSGVTAQGVRVRWVWRREVDGSRLAAGTAWRPFWTWRGTEKMDDLSLEDGEEEEDKEEVEEEGEEEEEEGEEGDGRMKEKGDMIDVELEEDSGW
ncbi:uncharacterized protein LAJ45_10694 [Morchella importuna]|uniref:uncharacterized protein n=1 Tax=Morchella importuna TaxID=1174673 RepID=UPI001E8EC918|nr:uncharacterized protein LAJ45_10694 [Morchella importuna]KAH8145257.1 hypothetical protein LAJ45_10694 [Morchella importuna]